MCQCHGRNPHTKTGSWQTHCNNIPTTANGSQHYEMIWDVAWGYLSSYEQMAASVCKEWLCHAVPTCWYMFDFLVANSVCRSSCMPFPIQRSVPKSNMSFDMSFHCRCASSCSPAVGFLFVIQQAKLYAHQLCHIVGTQNCLKQFSPRWFSNHRENQTLFCESTNYPCIPWKTSSRRWLGAWHGSFNDLSNSCGKHTCIRSTYTHLHMFTV